MKYPSARTIRTMMMTIQSHRGMSVLSSGSGTLRARRLVLKLTPYPAPGRSAHEGSGAAADDACEHALLASEAVTRRAYRAPRLRRAHAG